MSMLKSLNIVALPKQLNSDPVMRSRTKLIMQLEHQRALALDPNHVITQQKWRKQDDGTKRLVERQRRVKRWWVTTQNGDCFFTVRYGARIIELDKGKTAIAVGQHTELVRTIDALIAAVRDGELDGAVKSSLNERRNRKRTQN